MELTEKDLSLVIAIVKQMGGAPSPKQEFSPTYASGQSYFFRTVTNYYTGRLVRETEVDYFIDECSWIPSTGRFNEAMKSGKFQEVEPYPSSMVVRVPKGGMIDSCNWPHALPREVV